MTKQIAQTPLSLRLIQLLGEGCQVASALGVWSMAFLGITILAANRLLGKSSGRCFAGSLFLRGRQNTPRTVFLVPVSMIL